jgi:hypothetical protein
MTNISKNLYLTLILLFVFGFFFWGQAFAFEGETEGLIYSDLAYGSRGDEVLLLQKWLGVEQTGFFGWKTEEAVKAYQIENNIVNSGDPLTTGFGRVGPLTRASLNAKFAGVNSGTGFEETISGRALRLEGGFVVVPDSENYDIFENSDFALSAWVKPDFLTNAKAIILAKGAASLGWNYGFGLEKRGKIFVRFNEADVTTDKAYLKPNEWQNIFVVYSAEKKLVSFYYNGKLVEEKLVSDLSFAPSPSPLTLGAAFDAGELNVKEPFLGAIEEALVYSVLLDPQEIEDYYNNSHPLAKTEDFNPLSLGGVLAYFDFEEETETDEGLAVFEVVNDAVAYFKQADGDDDFLGEIMNQLGTTESEKAVNQVGLEEISTTENKEVSESVTKEENINQSEESESLKEEKVKEEIAQQQKQEQNQQPTQQSITITAPPTSNTSQGQTQNPVPVQCQPPILSGKQEYFVSTSQNPQFYEMSVDPQDVAKYAYQTVIVKIRDQNQKPVTQVQGEARTDNGSVNFQFSQISGTPTDGTWQGTWFNQDTYCQNYTISVSGQSESGTSQVTLTIR